MSDLASSVAVAPTRPLPANTEGAERAALLNWLADLFARPPTADRIGALRRELAMFDGAPCDGSSAFAAGIDRITQCLATDADDDALAVRLSIAFGRLFLGIGGPETVAPCESFYRCDGRLFQEPTAEMERLLAAHDLSVASGEPADHVSIELALLAALTEADHPDRDALTERLALWLPPFRDLLIRRDATGFWSGAATMLTATIELDAACRSVLQSV